MSWVNSAGPRTGAGRMGLRAQEPPIASAPPEELCPHLLAPSTARVPQFGGRAPLHHPALRATASHLPS